MAHLFSPYDRFLRSQVPDERVDPFSYLFPTCVYNNGRCGARCGYKRNGQPYRKCDRHRLRHNEHQRRHVENRGRFYQAIDINDALDIAEAQQMDTVEDPRALWSDERLFASLMASLPSTEVDPPTELTMLYTETGEAGAEEEHARDEIDHLLDNLESYTGE